MKQFDNFNMSVLILNHITIYMKIKTLFQNDNDVLNRKKLEITIEGEIQ